MAFKETKRKGFNFFRSYYDVFNELTNDKDKLAFIEALFDRQFLGVKPIGLKGMAKFAWISQVNSIDSQVKGYEDKTKTTLNKKKITPTDGGSATPTEQVQEEVQVQVQGEEKGQDVLSASPFSFYNSLLNLGCDKQLLSDWLKVRKTKKATNSQTAFNGFVKQVSLAKITYNEALEICATNSWAGFKNEWYQNVKNQNNEQRINNSEKSFGNQGTSRVGELEELVRRNSSPPNN